jgi:DNA-directed RNA polymerase specialized sigma24 family protein
MSSDGSISHWLVGVKEGDPVAVQAVWRRYFPELVRVARAKLEGVPRRVADEEDAALSAFESFCRAARQGRFPDLADRDDLWRLLLRITAYKAVDLRRREVRERRTRAEFDGAGSADDDGFAPGELEFAQVIGDAPTPEFAAMMAEECGRLLKRLGDPDLQALAVAKMEGYTNGEIAAARDCSERTVERRLHLIRKKWENEGRP